MISRVININLLFLNLETRIRHFNFNKVIIYNIGLYKRLKKTKRLKTFNRNSEAVSGV